MHWQLRKSSQRDLNSRFYSKNNFQKPSKKLIKFLTRKSFIGLFRDMKQQQIYQISNKTLAQMSQSKIKLIINSLKNF